MEKTVARNEGDVSDLTAIRQEAREASNKADLVQNQMGDPQKQVAGLQIQMSRSETMLQGIVGSQIRATEPNTGVCAHQIQQEEGPRIISDPALPGELDLEMMKRVKELGQINLNSTQGVQVNVGHEGFALAVNMDLAPFKMDIDGLLTDYAKENGTAFTNLKRVWMTKKFSYIYEGRPKTNSGVFMQSLFLHCIGHMTSRSSLPQSQPYKPHFKIYLSLGKDAEFELDNIKELPVDYAKAKELAFAEANQIVDVEDAKHILQNDKLLGDRVEEVVKEWDAHKEEFYEKTGESRHGELAVVGNDELGVFHHENDGFDEITQQLLE